MWSRFRSMWHPDEFSPQPNILFLSDYFQHALCPLSSLGTEVIKMSVSFLSYTCTLRNTTEYPRRLDSLLYLLASGSFRYSRFDIRFQTFLQSLVVISVKGFLLEFPHVIQNYFLISSLCLWCSFFILQPVWGNEFLLFL